MAASLAMVEDPMQSAYVSLWVREPDSKLPQSDHILPGHVSQVSTSDPDATPMHLKGGGTHLASIPIL